MTTRREFFGLLAAVFTGQPKRWIGLDVASGPDFTGWRTFGTYGTLHLLHGKEVVIEECHRHVSRVVNDKLKAGRSS